MERSEIYECLYSQACDVLREMMQGDAQLSKITWDQLDSKYLQGKKKNYTVMSLVEIYQRLLESAQNYQHMPNVIKFRDEARRKKIERHLDNYDIRKIATMDVDSLYRNLRKEFAPTSNDTHYNCWYKWSQSAIEAARFLSDFKDAEDFRQFVKCFDYNTPTRMALPMLISSKIKGIGFALACDFLKEIGYLSYPKSDVHLIDVFSEIGLTNRAPVEVFEEIIRMAKVCNVTPYKLDKVIWLVCSGNFYHEEIKIPGHKQELIERVKKSVC